MIEKEEGDMLTHTSPTGKETSKAQTFLSEMYLYLICQENTKHAKNNENML